MTERQEQVLLPYLRLFERERPEDVSLIAKFALIYLGWTSHEGDNRRTDDHEP